MNKLLIVLSALVLLAACQVSDTPSFNRMTPDQLQAYNESVELLDMVYCFEEVRIGSHMKKKYCLSILEIATAVENSAAQIGTIHYGGNGVTSRFIQN